ncbi:MAG: DNA-methyltransferase [Halobacteriales archaeon]|tara:strand:- start:1803 stop:2843 length:1041 start_codon:yes stop_codon:yes gene_type:complete
METKHKIIFNDSRDMRYISNDSIDLIVTSPPYPMIEMWDDLFTAQNPKIKEALSSQNGILAFNLMHEELNKVWSECYRALKKGGYACINIGDATRTLGGEFQLYPSHAKILSFCSSIGFHALPGIIWKKQTNSPAKFMGSGMLPTGAYVTLEYEHILLLRKSGKRKFKTEEEKKNRQKSAIFWEERNQWFSDLWQDLKGNRQSLHSEDLRARSAAYPLELSTRLINMFSVQGDLVLDPYLGTGTTLLSAIASGRNSVGIELNESFGGHITQRITDNSDVLKNYSPLRLQSHFDFVQQRENDGKTLKYINTNYSTPVVTKQEINLTLPTVLNIHTETDCLHTATYLD